MQEQYLTGDTSDFERLLQQRINQGEYESTKSVLYDNFDEEAPVEEPLTFVQAKDYQTVDGHITSSRIDNQNVSTVELRKEVGVEDVDQFLSELGDSDDHDYSWTMEDMAYISSEVEEIVS